MATGDIRYKITATGYNELRAKLKGGELFSEPYKEGMARIGNVGASSVRFAAPVGPTMRTANNVRSVVSGAKVPRFVRIDELAKSSRGFPYPRLLEFSPYAQSRYKKGTNKHKLWMKHAIDAVVPTFEEIFEHTADQVEQRWAQ